MKAHKYFQLSVRVIAPALLAVCAATTAAADVATGSPVGSAAAASPSCNVGVGWQGPTC